MSRTKMKEIVGHYPHLFSDTVKCCIQSTVTDTQTERQCKMCALMKGATQYSKSKRMKEKQHTA